MKMNAWEKAAMGFLLSGNRPSLRRLRTQAKAATVSRRQRSANSVVTHWRVPDTVERLSSSGADYDILDVAGELPDMGLALDFHLLIRKGAIRRLTTYAYADDLPNLTEVRFYYLEEKPAKSGMLYRTDSRDWKYFNRMWAISHR
jgi:hypothetical protein